MNAIQTILLVCLMALAGVVRLVLQKYQIRMSKRVPGEDPVAEEGPDRARCRRCRLVAVRRTPIITAVRPAGDKHWRKLSLLPLVRWTVVTDPDGASHDLCGLCAEEKRTQAETFVAERTTERARWVEEQTRKIGEFQRRVLFDEGREAEPPTVEAVEVKISPAPPSRGRQVPSLAAGVEEVQGNPPSNGASHGMPRTGFSWGSD